MTDKTNKTITIGVIGDTAVEMDETFHVRILDPEPSDRVVISNDTVSS